MPVATTNRSEAFVARIMKKRAREILHCSFFHLLMDGLIRRVRTTSASEDSLQFFQ